MSHLSSQARHLLLILRRLARREGYAWAGQDRLAGEMGLSVRSVQAYLRELTAAGMVKVERYNRQKTNQYYLLAPSVNSGCLNPEAQRAAPLEAQRAAGREAQPAAGREAQRPYSEF